MMFFKQGRHHTWTDSSLEVLVQTLSLSCLARMLTTTPQISSPSVKCSPIHAMSCTSASLLSGARQQFKQPFEQ